MEQQELGAQALLQLGNKKNKTPPPVSSGDLGESVSPNIRGNGNDNEIQNNDMNDQEHSNQSHDSDPTSVNIHEQVHDIKEEHKDISNDAVEAAVMRYVGGTLENQSNLTSMNNLNNLNLSNLNSTSRKRKLTHEDLISNINEFNQWAGFLEDDLQVQQQPDEYYQSPNSKNHQSNNQPNSGNGSNNHHVGQNQGPNQNQNQGNGVNALIGDKKRKKLKSSSNHNLNVDPELAQLDTATEHEQLVQAAIMDARELASQFGGSALQEHDYLRHQGNNGANQQQQQQQQHSQQAQQHSHHQQHHQQLHQQQAHSSQQSSDQQQLDDKSHLSQSSTNTEAAALVAAAAERAGSWVNQSHQPHGRMFSQEETDAIDRFITAYCEINNMSRRDICERVWSNERKKDDFWESLQKVLPHRSRASVYKHVRRSYHIFDVRGKWTKEEDEQLGKLATEKDGQWKAIGQIMGRMPEDCRDRWRNYVKCGDIRAQNKWNQVEEDRLKQIISDMLNDANQQPIINWTIVSERMQGTRSRIQCRYKWNKLLKREATARAQTIGSEDRIWLLDKLKQLNYENFEEIDWDGLAAIHETTYWNGSDFKICFEKMRSSIRDFKKKKLDEICGILLQDLYNDVERLSGRKRIGDDNTAIASAAVAAAVQNQQVNTPDEYAIWR